MANIFEAGFTTLKSLADDEKQLLHTGEVMEIWLYQTAMAEALRYERLGLKTTEDEEVKEMLIDAIKTCSKQLNKIEEFMKKEGIPLSDELPDKPDVDSGSIPLGVKLTDDEITNGVGIKVAAMIIQCATAQAQSVRNDVALMWVGFQFELIVFGATLKSLMKKRGWLKVPPFYSLQGAVKK